jgi:hypothetical protein
MANCNHHSQCICTWSDCKAIRVQFSSVDDKHRRGDRAFQDTLSGDETIQFHRRTMYSSVLRGGEPIPKDKLSRVYIARHHFPPLLLNIFKSDARARRRIIPSSFYNSYLRPSHLKTPSNDSRVHLFKNTRNGVEEEYFIYLPSQSHLQVLEQLHRLVRGCCTTELRQIRRSITSFPCSSQQLTMPNDIPILTPDKFDFREASRTQDKEIQINVESMTPKKRKHYLRLAGEGALSKSGFTNTAELSNNEWICNRCTYMNDSMTNPPPYCALCANLAPRRAGSLCRIRLAAILLSSESENQESLGFNMAWSYGFDGDGDAFNERDEKKVAQYRRIARGVPKTEYQLAKTRNEAYMAYLQAKDMSANISDYSLWVFSPNANLTRYQVLLHTCLSDHKSLQKCINVVHEVQRSSIIQLSLWKGLDTKLHGCLGAHGGDELRALITDEAKIKIVTIKNDENLEFDPANSNNPIIFNNLLGFTNSDNLPLECFLTSTLEEFWIRHLEEALCLMEVEGINSQRSVINLNIGFTPQDARQWERKFDGDSAMPGFMLKQMKLSPLFKKDLGQILFYLTHDFPAMAYRNHPAVDKFWEPDPKSWRHENFASKFAVDLQLSSEQNKKFRNEAATINLWKRITCDKTKTNEGDPPKRTEVDPSKRKAVEVLTFKPLGIHTDILNDNRSSFDDCETLNFNLNLISAMKKRNVIGTKREQLLEAARKASIDLSSFYGTFIGYLRSICGDKADQRIRGYNSSDPICGEFLHRLEERLSCPMQDELSIMDVELLDDPCFPLWLATKFQNHDERQYVGQYALLTERWRKLFYMSSIVDDEHLLQSKYNDIYSYRDTCEIYAFSSWYANGQFLVKMILSKWLEMGVYLNGLDFRVSKQNIKSIYQMMDEEAHLYSTSDQAQRQKSNKKARANVTWVSSEHPRVQQSSPLFSYHPDFAENKDRALWENAKRIDAYMKHLADLRDEKSTIEEAYEKIKALKEVGHFGAMTSLQLAAAGSCIQTKFLRFGKTTSTGKFKTYEFLQKHSIEFIGIVGKSEHEQATKAALCNISKCLSNAGYNLSDMVIEQMCCLFERHDNVSNGIPSPIIKFDVLFKSKSGIVQNFYKPNKEYTEMLILVHGEWVPTARFIKPWYCFRNLNNTTKSIVLVGGVPQTPFRGTNLIPIDECQQTTRSAK